MIARPEWIFEESEIAYATGRQDAIAEIRAILQRMNRRAWGWVIFAGVGWGLFLVQLLREVLD